MLKTTLAAGILIGAAIGIPIGPTIITAHAAPITVQEDDPGWDCVTMGNRVCGPDGDNLGHAAGCYNDTAQLVASWPCYIVVNPDGSSDVYTG